LPQPAFIPSGEQDHARRPPRRARFPDIPDGEPRPRLTCAHRNLADPGGQPVGPDSTALF
jgi:hypothetical protein